MLEGEAGRPGRGRFGSARLRRRHRRGEHRGRQRISFGRHVGLRIPCRGELRLQRACPVRQEPEARGGAGRILGSLPRRETDHVPPPERGDVARREAVHVRGCDVHLPEDDRSEHPDRLRGGFPAGDPGGQPRPVHLRCGVREALRARPGLVGDARPPEAPPCGISRHLPEPPEQEAGGDRPVPVPGVEDRGEDRLRGEPGLLRGKTVPLPRRHARHPGPRHDVPRAQVGGDRHDGTHPPPVHASDGDGGVREVVQQIPVSLVRIHLPGIPPLPPALFGQAGPAGLRPCHQQEGDHRRRPLRPRAGGDGTLQARHMGPQPRREAIPLRSREGEGTPCAGRMEGRGRQRHAGKGREEVRLHGPDQRGKREPGEDGGDHPAEPGRRRDPDGDPDAGVGRLHQRVRRQAEIRRGDPRLEHHAGPRSVRHLEFEEDRAEGAEFRGIQGRRGGPAPRGGAAHIRHRKRKKAYQDPGNPGGGATVRLPLLPGRAPGGAATDSRDRACPAGISYNFIKWYVPRGSRSTPPSSPRGGCSAISPAGFC